MADNPLSRGQFSGSGYTTVADPTTTGDASITRARPSKPRSARDRIIPNWIGGTDPSGQLRPSATGAIQKASTPQVTQAPTIAEDAIIPIVYGGPERLAGMPYTTCANTAGSALVVSFILCEGEVQAVANIEINDEAPPAGVTLTVYRGAPGQGVDPTLAACIPGFAEAMPGTAYVVGVFPAATMKSAPRLTAEVMGLLIPDHRSGLAVGAWNNPALILTHFMRTYARRTVNQASANAAATWCDTLIGADKRARLTITLAESRDTADWIEVLRGYLPAWVVEREGEWHIVLDQASAAVLAYNADTDARTDGEAPMVLYKRGARDVPNVIEIQYTDTTVKPWTLRKARATLGGLGTGAIRKSTLTMPGIRHYAQAYRFAVERLNHYTLESIEGELAVMDEGIALLPGDIVTVTDSAHGWDTKAVRVLRVDERDNGRWGLRFREFSALAYSTDAPAAPPTPSSGTLPNPRTVGAIVGLTAAESLKFENSAIGNDGIARGLIWQSRIEATWSASADPYFDLYEIAIKSPSLAQPSVSASRLPQFSSAPVIQGTTYTVDVRAINSLGFASAWTSVSVPVLGKQTPPSNVTVLDFAAEVGGEVILRWKPVPDPDVGRYEWRGLASAAASAPWDSMAVLDRPDTNYTRIKGIAPGATLFAIKAIDSVGRYSVDALYVNLTVTSDASSFLQTFAFTPVLATSTNIAQQDFPIAENGTRPLPRWITAAQTAWDAAMPNPVGSAAAPVVNAWGRNSGFTLVTDQFDFGLVLEATVNLDLTWVKATRGSVWVYLLNSVNGSSWDSSKFRQIFVGDVLGRVSFAVAARFLRVEIWHGVNTDAVMVEGIISAQISSQTRKESGTGSSLASGPLRVNLAQKYTKAVSITITPMGTAFATASFDNVIVGLSTTPNSFDVYIFNSTGVQIARDFAWAFAGV